MSRSREDELTTQNSWKSSQRNLVAIAFREKAKTKKSAKNEEVTIHLGLERNTEAKDRYSKPENNFWPTPTNKAPLTFTFMKQGGFKLEKKFQPRVASSVNGQQFPSTSSTFYTFWSTQEKLDRTNRTLSNCHSKPEKRYDLWHTIESKAAHLVWCVYTSPPLNESRIDQ